MKDDRKILIVENDFIISTSIKLMLINHFYAKNIYMAKNGLEGLSLFQNYKPDIILTDIKMPIMDGYEMTRKIRDLKYDVPIIVISAWEKEIYKMVEKFDIKSTLLKPITEIRLMKAIGDLQ